MALHPAIDTALQGGSVLWGAPTYGACLVGLEEMQHAAAHVATFHMGLMRVAFRGGGKVQFVSLEKPDNARGKTGDGVVIDEAAFCPERAYYEVLRPMVSDTGGWVLAMGTPWGRNWFWREHMSAQDDPDAIAFQAPTLGIAIEDGQLTRKRHPLENPNFPFAEAQAMWRQMPERTFRQEFLAEFLESGGGVFRRVMEAATLQPQAALKDHTYVIGCDWGRSVDYSVFCVMDATTRQLVYMDRSNRVDYAVQRGRLMALTQRYKPTAILAEQNSIGQPIIESLQRDGLPIRAFTTTNATKAQIIEALVLAFEQGTIQILADPILVGELEAYESQTTKAGTTTYSAPEGMHDDTVMGLALAWAACGRPTGASLLAWW